MRDSPASQPARIDIFANVFDFVPRMERKDSAKFLKHFFICFLFPFLENLAFNKPTKVISTYHTNTGDKAVDGDSQTVFGQSSCTSSHSETNPWWRVDLQQVEPVNEVYIVNRGDCCGDRLNSFEIRVGKTKLSEALLKIIVTHKPRKTNKTKFLK